MFKIKRFFCDNRFVYKLSFILVVSARLLAAVHKIFKPPVHMTRCDYDAVFYRVFCITLLGIAFTFTIILTNVFVDIDGLLSKKEKSNQTAETETVESVQLRDDYTKEITNKYEKDDEEMQDTYRRKRSLETQNVLFHIENPKMKTMLKQKLANLLEELDEEESLESLKPDPLFAPKRKAKEIEYLNHKQGHREKTIANKKNKNKDGFLLHLALHNALLYGIISHMDSNEVYKRVHRLVHNFKKEQHHRFLTEKMDFSNSVESVGTIWKHGQSKEVEDRFFKELLNSKELEHQMLDGSTNIENKSDRRYSNHHRGPNVLIKTLIDITSSGKDKTKKDHNSESKENVEGVVKLIFNGKNIHFNRAFEDTTTRKPKPSKIIREVVQTPTTTERTLEKTTKKINSDEIYNYKAIPKSHMNKFIEEYLKRLAFKGNGSLEKTDPQIKRAKRDIKVKYENDSTTEKDKIPKTDDDELYVEIETHFDSKGMKGEKKKKLIRSLIQKIQKAIHSDMEDDIVKKHKNLHVKRRSQNPLEAKGELLLSQMASPFNEIVHRQIDPITKINLFQDLDTPDKSEEAWKKGSADFVSDKSGEAWRKRYLGPRFLTLAKSINSAEMSELDVDYSKNLNINGIPQRLQRPLNTDTSDEQGNTFTDVNNMKFFLKDVDGAGFSIGFNQYVDEPPDAESIKLFTGLENIINTYHQKYDQPTEQGVVKADQDNHETLRDESKGGDDHIVVRRSIKEKHDYHSNEYKVIFDNNFLPYDNYQEIYDNPKHNQDSQRMKKLKKTSMPFVIDENIFNKNLRPAEIFGLANLFQRKKRSLNVKKITNLKSKMRLSRFLNTHPMSTKRVYMNNKRNKRQINKIRIIASDLPHIHRHSSENIYVVSDENVFADRAIIREVEPPQSDTEDYHKVPEEQYEYTPEEENTTPVNVYDRRSRHNALSSKYPHILMEELVKSKEEDFGLDNTFLFSKLFDRDQDIERNDNDVVSIDSIPRNSSEISPNVEQVLNSMAPANSNIKVTVKVLPKNGTGLNSGFKEVHTSINKSYNKNGLLYSSLVNVSEISKVIKINKTVNDLEDLKLPDSELGRTIKTQQNKMQLLLKQHKDHLDDQLQKLNDEKIRLESMFTDAVNASEGTNDYVELVIRSNPNQIIRLSRDQLTELSGNVLIVNATETSKTAVTTPKPIPTTTVSLIDRMKNKMLRSIQHNENLTYQILNKIDKNTEILQIFLAKLTDTIVKPQPKEWRPMINFDPNTMMANNNSSHVSIPFLYAYQQPITPHKPDKVASVVYHGHIHTNTLDNDYKKNTEKPYVRPEVNQTKFFIDDLQSDYKVISEMDVKKDKSLGLNEVNYTLNAITSSGKDKIKQDYDLNSKENVEGLIKVEDPNTHKLKAMKIKEVVPTPTNERTVKISTTKINSTEVYIKNGMPKSLKNKLIVESFKSLAVKDNDNAEKSGIKKKLTQRDVKVKYEEDDTTENHNIQIPKSEDDELYVQIETHFDGIGLKHKKNQKLIKRVIPGIQKAINSNMKNDTGKKRQELHVKKSTQNPLKSGRKLPVRKIVAPFNYIIHRQINPITRVGPFQDSYTAAGSTETWKKSTTDYLTYQSGETLRKGYLSPGFLTAAKHINSNEISEVNVDYNKTINGDDVLQQRLQKPLNTDTTNTNLKNKMTLNRYLNTHTASTKRIYRNKTRNKRQINEMKMIASVLPHNIPTLTHSDENINLISDENVFANTDIVKEVEALHLDNKVYRKVHNEQSEYTFEEGNTTPTNIFFRRSRHNALSSKYPHIFIEEIIKSKEEFSLNDSFIFSKLIDRDRDIESNDNGAVKIYSIATKASHAAPKVKNISSPKAPTKAHVKVTIKVPPNNGTGLNSGFKELQTSINKSYHKDGLLYSSLVNVSEISKMTNINKTENKLNNYKKSDSTFSTTSKKRPRCSNKACALQFLLKKHKDHLDFQLKKLNEEKTRLESMVTHTNTSERMNDFVELIIPSNPNQIIKVSRDKLREIAANSLTINTATTTEASTTMKPIAQITAPIKQIFQSATFHSTENDEYLAHHILDKIDKNTDMLQNFLKHLTDTISKQQPKEWRPMINFNPDSVMGTIPIIYAYDQPAPPNVTDTVTTEHNDHLSTNAAIEDDNNNTVKPYIEPESNSTNHLKDNLGNDYKVISSRQVKTDKPVGNNTVV